MITPTNTNEPSNELSLLKTDTRVRVRVPKERRAEILAQFDRSAMSAAAFARLHGIKYTTFNYWLKVRRQSGAAKSPTLVEVVEASAFVPSAGESPLCVELPGDARLEITDATSVKLAASLLRELSGGTSC